MWGTLHSCPLIFFTPASPHNLSLAAAWTNAARVCQGPRHRRGALAACRGKGTHTTHYYTYHTLLPPHPFHPPTHSPSDVPVSAYRPAPLHSIQPPSFTADRCTVFHTLCPFLQKLRGAATRGDVVAVRTLLSESASSVAGFINGASKVRETLTFLLLSESFP
jgi:hypothetical protein